MIHIPLWIFAVSWTAFAIFFDNAQGLPFVGYLRFLGATEYHVGLFVSFMSIPVFLQIFSAYLISRAKDDRKIFFSAGLIARSLWFWVPLSAFLVFKGFLSRQTAMSSLLLMVFLYAIANSFVGTSCFSWVGKYAPKGRKLSVINSISVIVGMGSVVLFAQYLGKNPGPVKFMVVSLVMAIAAVTDVLIYLVFVNVPPTEPEPQPLKEAIFLAWRGEGFLVTLSAITMNIFLSAVIPFIDYYLLKEIKLSFSTIGLYRTLPLGLGYFLFAPIVGSFRTNGRANVFLFASVLLPLALYMVKYDIRFTILAALLQALRWSSYDIMWMEPTFHLYGGRKNALFFSSFSFSSIMPMLVLPTFWGMLIADYGYQRIFLVSSAGAFLASLVILFFKLRRVFCGRKSSVH